MSALDMLSKMGAEGLTAEDRASLNAARRQVSGDEQARQAAILQNMAQRGVDSGGMELAARLSSSQAAADRAGQQSDNLMAMAQRRMLESLSQAGALGGNIRQQDYGEQSNLAQARDAIAQFNTQQAAATQARNIAARNAAQSTNLQDKQRIADANVATRNAQQQYNRQLPQQTFNNQMQLGTAKANSAIGQGTNLQNQAQVSVKLAWDFIISIKNNWSCNGEFFRSTT
jgi:hypothetical protein